MIVELKNIHKYFGSLHANDNISLTCYSGAIQGIIGENGAGKSTLMKILSGSIQADKGEILIDQTQMRFHSPEDALLCGIGMLHQDPQDFPTMRVIDNILLGEESNFFPKWKRISREILDLNNNFNFSVDPYAYVDSMTVGERQQMEILRLLWLGIKVLILDEPTTGISEIQKQKLFETLRKLANEGMVIVFVSHKLDEVESLCNKVAVLQRGKLVGEKSQPYNTHHLIKMMFGKNITIDPKQSLEFGSPVVEISNLEIESYKFHIKNINLSIRKGEVVGLAGMEGSGQRLFLKSLSGQLRPVGGKILINGKDLSKQSLKYFQQHGVNYVPASRLEEGLIAGLTLREHFSLVFNNKRLTIKRKDLRLFSENQIENFNIQGKPESFIEDLSGGNQQRALFALLRKSLNLLLIEHPSRGLDIESSLWIWNNLKDRCKDGTSIVFISSDLEEILYYSDKILVFFNEKVSNPILAKNTSEKDLGLLISGIGFDN